MIKFILPLTALFSSCITSPHKSIDLLDEPNNWSKSNFGSNGEIGFEPNLLKLNMGDPITGITWNKSFPKKNYEITLEAKRTQGNDFFCGLTFPVNENFCSLIVSGWGGMVTGLSNLDGLDASENKTTKILDFENNRWYKIRLRVSETFIQVWLDNKELIKIDHTQHKISIRPKVDPSKPLGLATFYTSAEYRNFHCRRVN